MIRPVASCSNVFEVILDILRQGERVRICPVEGFEQWLEASHIFGSVIFGSTRGGTAFITIERPFWYLHTRWIAAKKVKDTWASFTADKLACTFAGSADVLAL